MVVGLKPDSMDTVKIKGRYLVRCFQFFNLLLYPENNVSFTHSYTETSLIYFVDREVLSVNNLWFLLYPLFLVHLKCGLFTCFFLLFTYL